MDKIRQSWENLDGRNYGGSGLQKGRAYHNIPILGHKNLLYHRGNTEKRVDLILKHSDVKGKRILDLGCSVGGISCSLAKEGARVVGIDYDPTAIKVAKAVAEAYKLDAEFYCGDIYDSAIVKESFDVCVWFDQFMWLVHKYGRGRALSFLIDISKNVPELWFETSVGDGMAGTSMRLAAITSQETMLNILKTETCYNRVDNLGTIDDGWYSRPIFHCYK